MERITNDSSNTKEVEHKTPIKDRTVRYMGPYSTYVTSVLELRLYFQVNPAARGVAVSFVVS